MLSLQPISTRTANVAAPRRCLRMRAGLEDVKKDVDGVKKDVEQTVKQDVKRSGNAVSDTLVPRVDELRSKGRTGTSDLSRTLFFTLFPYLTTEQRLRVCNLRLPRAE
jgi:hypothetical protein